MEKWWACEMESLTKMVKGAKEATPLYDDHLGLLALKAAKVAKTANSRLGFL